jgi:hypothetical protein
LQSAIGTDENSPQFQLWDCPRKNLKSPAGTIEGRVSAVPAGLDVFPTGPGIEMPGYFRWFLRNQNAGLKLTCSRIKLALDNMFYSSDTRSNESGRSALYGVCSGYVNLKLI